MISLLKKIFLQNWLRKLISLVLAIIIWIVVDQSLTTTKVIGAVPIKIVNIPEGKTITGLQSTGHLSRRFSLTVTGKKSHVEDISANDLEIVLNAAGVPDEWVVSIEKKHLVSLNPELNIEGHISKLLQKNLIIKFVPLTKEKISVYVTQPIGEPPKGYQFLDIWPYHLNLTVGGPEDVLKKLKSHGIKLTFNLNDISLSEIERLGINRTRDVITYYIPDKWKNIHLPAISEKPLAIDDPDGKLLRIDFIRSDTIPIKFDIPVVFFASPDHLVSVNPSHLTLVNSALVSSKKGIKVINKSLYTKGVSEIFVKTIQDMVAISINLVPASDESGLNWSIQFINPRVLEDRYINLMLTEAYDDELKDMNPRILQEYLRNRFRNYMNRFQLYTEDDKLLDLNIQLSGKELVVKEEYK